MFEGSKLLAAKFLELRPEWTASKIALCGGSGEHVVALPIVATTAGRIMTFQHSVLLRDPAFLER